jgi:hypothetical protein
MDVREWTEADRRADVAEAVRVAWGGLGTDFVMVDEAEPPARIALGRERMLLCRLYLGLIQTINEDYGAAFASHSDSASFRAVGICARSCARPHIRARSRAP